jgi:hypothetical protein
MKHFFSCVVLCLIVIMLLFGIETVSRLSEMEKQTDIKLYQLEEVIEQQAKEIRLLKTDLEILENGYERSTEKEAEL